MNTGGAFNTIVLQSSRYNTDCLILKDSLYERQRKTPKMYVLSYLHSLSIYSMFTKGQAKCRSCFMNKGFFTQYRNLTRFLGEEGELYLGLEFSHSGDK